MTSTNLNILFIWYGKESPLYDMRQACIQRAIELYPDAKFHCITTMKSFYHMDVINAYDLQKEMIEAGCFSEVDGDYKATSDEMRFYYLSKNPNTLYLDTDTWCTKRRKFSETPGQVSIEALWNGNDVETFKTFMDTQEKGTYYVYNESDLKLEDMSEYFLHCPQELPRFGLMARMHHLKKHYRLMIDKDIYTISKPEVSVEPEEVEVLKVEEIVTEIVTEEQTEQTQPQTED